MDATVVRSAQPEDHAWIVRVVDHWWGRPIADALPRLFLDHFFETSLVVTQSNDPIGFLVGFMSPSHPDAAYIHFVGVHPDHRGAGLARKLYEEFFDLARSSLRRTVSAITAAENWQSIAFHRRMGFDVSPVIDDYNRPETQAVVFSRPI